MNLYVPQDFFKNNLDFYPINIDLTGQKIESKKMKDRLGFLPCSLWKPDLNITKELKKQINDIAQVRPTLNANRGDRRHGVNGGKCSVFNPHLAQMILAGYCKPNSKIYDPFGGGGTRGYIATKMGHSYTGIEIRNEEVDRIKEQMNNWNLNFNILLADSRNYIPNDKFNFSFTCPPYYDLELYSNLDGDLSNCQDYSSFLLDLKKVIKNVYNCLEENSFSVWVVGNFRNKKGEIEHLNGDLVKLAKAVGFKLWDELIWQGASNVALTRCGKFECNRKSVRMHEYILIFKK